jgi:starch synthase
MNILFIASECVPFAKTGGLADVVGALPKYLKALGHDVIVVIPKYASINASKFGMAWAHGPMGVWMGDGQEWCAVHRADRDGVPIYFIEHDGYFGRAGLYHDANFNDYLDNPRRFGFLTRAAFQFCKDVGFKPDVIHAHDWHTALAPAYLKIWDWNDATLGNAASLLTIHNIAYQGKYPAGHLPYLGLQQGNFTQDKFEDNSALNFLKGGIVYADMVNTVSPNYARETRTPALGYGMAPYLNNKGANYIGILNGCDYTQWNPETDKTIPATFSADDLSGKAICKRELQKRFLLNVDPNVPIVGVVSRLVDQKGLDLLAASIERIVANMQVQFAILGSGDKGLERFFGGLPARYPGRIGSYIGYSDEIAHWVEAGADFFVMPSIFEPCGLNQMYSLRYGTLPIVRATGGLDDTVEQYDEVTGAGTGFKFFEASPNAIYYAVGWAVSTYFDRPEHMQKMIRAAMAQDFSWERSTAEYVKAYERAIANKRR